MKTEAKKQGEETDRRGSPCHGKSPLHYSGIQLRQRIYLSNCGILRREQSPDNNQYANGASTDASGPCRAGYPVKS